MQVRQSEVVQSVGPWPMDPGHNMHLTKLYRRSSTGRGEAPLTGHAEAVRHGIEGSSVAALCLTGEVLDGITVTSQGGEEVCCWRGTGSVLHEKRLLIKHILRAAW